MNTYPGSCLCGDVRFEVGGTFRHFFLCHCSRCRKGSGSVHGANLFAPGGTVDWLSGADRLCRFDLPGTRHARAFCGSCGSPLPLLQGDLLVVPAGALDGPAPIGPVAHICLDSRAAWDRDLGDLPGLGGLPGA